MGSIEQKVGDFFASFMNVEMLDAKGIEPLRADLELIDTIDSSAELNAFFARFGLTATTAPIEAHVHIDPKNPDRYLLNITHAGLGLPDRDYYLEKNERFNHVRAVYEAHIVHMLKLSGMKEKAASHAATKIIELESTIARHHWPREELRDRDKTYNPHTIDELESAFPEFPWRGYLAAAGMTDIRDVNVRTPSAILPLAKLIKETPYSTWRAYLRYHLIANNAKLLSQEIDDAQFSFAGKILDGVEAQRERWKRGVELVSGDFRFPSLGEAIGQIYVSRHFPPESKEKMDVLVENLRRAFRERIKGLPWMGEETKQEALAKLESFRPKIGYPSKWRSFDSVEISRDDLLKNVKAVRKYWHDDDVSRLSKPTDKDEWFMTPQTVNAYYNPSFNEIVFPAAILQPPFFDPRADPAVNYGAIGAVIGHEMGHGFDDQGSKSDAKGVQRNWWSDADRARFEERTGGLVEQYNKYEPIAGHTVNGKFTLGENIGDLGGLSIAHHAYHLFLEGTEPPVIDGLTGDQRFFLAWAQIWRSKNRPEFLLRRLKSDPHSPEEFRVNGIVRNMDAWYEAFEVGKDAKLFLPPQARVSIW
jgi:putative endopeptidase